MNRTFKSILTSCLLASLAVAGSTSFALEPESKKPMGTNFALKLFSEQTKGETNNVLVSPFSAYFALSMTLNGAAGKTREQMAEVLGTTADSVQQLNDTNAEIMKALALNANVKLEVANAIYADQSTPFKKSFIDLCKSSYDAAIYNEDFSKSATVTAINSWCSEKTHGKVSKILEMLAPNEKMVLLNAIYFKGAWQNQFAKGATRSDQFTQQSGDKIAIQMMHRNAETNYLKGSNFSSIVLPYVGNRQRMHIFLPNEGVDIATLKNQFTADNWDKWRLGYSSAQVNLSLPKFKIEYEAKLRDTLKAIGMHNAFDPSADFSNMIDGKAWINRVLQKTYMDVNEEGTEAAAVTAVTMMTRAMAHRPTPSVEFRVDRPFIIALVDEPTQEILFLGTVAKP